MRALHKSKRVSWPPDFKLCQVRLFISEDSPSQVGSESQDHLQAKSSWASHPSDDNLPPGFCGPRSADESQIKLSDIPVIKWNCSVRILLDEEWRVVAGDESKEVEAQNQRELRVLEAFYPGASAIPQNPSVPADVDNSHFDDQQTIIIPILPVEDDDIAMESASDLSTQSGMDVGTEPSITEENTSISSILPAGSNILAALSAISNSKEQDSSMIDQDLLIKILSNPKLVENLVGNCGDAGSVSSNASSLYPPTSSNGQFYPQTHIPHILYPLPAPPARDASYYKNLIQQHGEERQETPPVQQLNNQRARDSKPKIMKPCMYYNTSRGCRNGANCSYQHDGIPYHPRNLNNGNSEMQNAKRMKFDRD